MSVNRGLFHSGLIPRVWRVWVSEQCPSHTFSKRNPHCLRTALSISDWAEPWCLPAGEQKEGGHSAHWGDPGGEGAG